MFLINVTSVAQPFTHKRFTKNTIYRRVKFRQRRLNGSLVLAIKPKLKEKFSTAAMLLFCILQTTVSSYKKFVILEC
jgi:hypothetical protein